MNSWLQIKTIKGFQGIRQIIQIKNTDRVLTIGHNHAIKIWETSTWHLVIAHYSFKSIHSISATNQANLIAFKINQNFQILDISSQMTQILGTHEKQVNQLSQIPGSDVIISASSDSTLCAWNITSNTLISTFTGIDTINSFAWIKETQLILIIQQNLKLYQWNYKTKSMVSLFQQKDENNETIYTFASLELAYDKLVLIGSTNLILKYNLSSNSILVNNSIEIINCLSLIELPNQRLATGNFSENIYIWNSTTNELIVQIYSAHFQGVLQLLYEKTTNYLISSSYDSLIKIYDADTFTLVNTLKSHINPVSGLALQSLYNQNILYSASWDHSIIAWDINTGEILKTFTNFPAYKILLIENSDRIATTNSDGVIEIFSKSYNCEINENTFQFSDCECKALGVYGVMQGDNEKICQIIQEEIPIFTAVTSPTSFKLTFLYDHTDLIEQIISNINLNTSLIIGNLESGKDYTYTLKRYSDNSFLIQITYTTTKILLNGTQVFFQLNLNDIIDNKYLLARKLFNYTLERDEMSCTIGFYFNKYSNLCEEIVVLQPTLSLTAETNVLKLTYLNEENNIFNKMINYIKVTEIEGYPSNMYTYIIQQESFNTYLIIFTFQQHMLDNPLVTVKINLPAEIILAGQVTLATDTLTINLLKSFYLSDEEEKTVESLGTATKVGTQMLTGLSLVGSITGSTSCFQMMLLLGLIELLKYQSINYTPQVLKIFDSEANFPPNFLESAQFKENNKADLDSIPENFSKYGVSPYILNNILSKVILIICSIIFGFLLVVLNKIILKFRKSKRTIVKSILSLWGWLYQWVVWNFVYFILISQFLDGIFFSLIEIINAPINTSKGKFNFFFGILFLIINLYLLYHFYLKIDYLQELANELKDVKSELNSPELPKKQQLKQIIAPKGNILNKLLHQFKKMTKYLYRPEFFTNQEKKQYLTDHEILFNDYKPDVVATYNFLLFELGRLIAICSVIVLLSNYPLLQTIINLLILVFFIIIIFIIKPYKKLIMAILSISAEFCVIMAYMGAFLFAQYDENSINQTEQAYKNIEKFIVYGVTGMTYISIVQMLINAFDFLKLLLQKFKQYQEKKRRLSEEIFQIKQIKKRKYSELQVQQIQPIHLQQGTLNEEKPCQDQPDENKLQEIVID